jgi:hypothetical protein
VTLANDDVRQMLRSRFVVGWHNIWRQPYVGQSNGYSRQQTAIGTSNGAGGRNMQVFVLSPDLVVLHALPGFWHPADFAHELRFAEALAGVWADAKLTRAQKDHLFRTVQLAELRSHDEATYARSSWQDFDAHTERARAAQTGSRDTLANLTCAGPMPTPAELASATMKPLNVLVHERMATRPFVPFAAFDVEAFVDYGQTYYDNNHGRGDVGVALPRPQPKQYHWL